MKQIVFVKQDVKMHGISTERQTIWHALGYRGRSSNPRHIRNPAAPALPQDRVRLLSFVSFSKANLVKTNELASRGDANSWGVPKMTVGVADLGAAGAAIDANSDRAADGLGDSQVEKQRQAFEAALSSIARQTVMDANSDLETALDETEDDG